jgi:hypothetical protein
VADLDSQWHGWGVHPLSDGQLFFHHPVSGLSQWQAPDELASMLGMWAHELNGSQGDSADVCLNTCLFQAAMDGNFLFLRLYVFAGGSLDVFDRDGRPALQYACAGGQAQVVLFLLQNDAVPDAPDKAAGATPLQIACRFGHTSIARLLLQAKADPDRRNSFGNTSMHEAAVSGMTDTLKCLFEAGANPACRNLQLKTPADIATEVGFKHGATLLWRFEWRANLTPTDTEESEPEESIALASRSRSVRQAGESRRPGPSKVLQPQAVDSTVVRLAKPVLSGLSWFASRMLGSGNASPAPNPRDSSEFSMLAEI